MTTTNLQFTAVQPGTGPVMITYQYTDYERQYAGFAGAPVQLTVTASGGGTTTPPSGGDGGTTPPTSSGCKDVYFIGSRGSGETLTYGLTKAEQRLSADQQKKLPHYGLGAPIARLYDEWSRTVPAGVTSGVMYNTYQALNALKYLPPTRREVVGLAVPIPTVQASAAASWYYGDEKHGISQFLSSVDTGRAVLVTMINNKLRECGNARFVGRAPTLPR